MGAIYEARRAGKRAAFKVAHQDKISPDSMERFRREAQILMELEHPYVVRCFSAGETEGFIYLALEHMGGGSLDDLLKRNGPLSVPQAVCVMRRVLQGLGAVHRAGVVHRDLKPDNVLLTERGRPKLADFGMARHRDHRKITQAGTILGTADYMSPEQFKGQPVDHRADLYAAGAMLYTLLTGAPPYEGRSSLAVLKQHADSPVPDPAALVPQAGALSAAVAKLMAKEPSDRPPDAEAALALFEGLSEAPLRVGGGPLTPLFGFQPLKRAGARPSRAADAAALLVALAVALAGVDALLQAGLLGPARDLLGAETLSAPRSFFASYWPFFVAGAALVLLVRLYRRLRHRRASA